MKLTKTAIDKMTYAGKSTGSDAKDVRWDDEVPGFGVRIWPSGKKTFFVIYRHHGRERFMTLGALGVLTLQQARDMAREVRVKVLRGQDPLSDRQRKADAATFGEFAAQYLARHAARKKSGAGDQALIENHLVPAWGNLPLTSIRRSDVAQLHHRLGEKKPEVARGERQGRNWKKGRFTGGPFQANRALSLLSTMFNLAKKWGYVAENWPNPTEHVDRFKEPERERFCSADEVRLLAAEIDKEPNLFVKSAIWGYLLTGARKSSLLRMRWSHIDFTGKRVTIPETKKGRAFVMPLTSHLEELLKRLPRLSGNPYVFCGRIPGSHVGSIDKNWQRIRKAVSLSEIRIHDLRHTVITWLANAGYSLALIGSAVDQTNERTTKRYAHLQLGPATRVLEAHGRQLKAILAATTENEIQAAVDAGGGHGSSPPPSGDPGPSPAAAGSR